MTIHFVPCPYCGGTDLGYRGNHLVQRVCCWTQGCEARGPVRATIEEARDAWNDRAILLDQEIAHHAASQSHTTPVYVVTSGPVPLRKLDPDDLTLLDE